MELFSLHEVLKFESAEEFHINVDSNVCFLPYTFLASGAKVTEAALVQTAFYGGYCLMALPAALFIRFSTLVCELGA